MRDEYKHGDYNIICDRSGEKIKFSESKKEWNGLRVKKEYWEPRHPQDLLRGHPDNQAVYDPRPESADSFIAFTLIALLTEAGVEITDEFGNVLEVE